MWCEGGCSDVQVCVCEGGCESGGEGVRAGIVV